MTDITPTSFRSNFPEFGDKDRYPDTLVQFWLDLAYIQCQNECWTRAGLKDMGVQLFTAHNVTLERKAMDEGLISAQLGLGGPGQSTGPIAAKSTDKVSVNYSTGDAIEEGGGSWNLTIYGVRFHKLMRLVGVTGIAFVG